METIINFHLGFDDGYFLFVKQIEFQYRPINVYLNSGIAFVRWGFGKSWLL